MTTQLKGQETYFLPFNIGKGEGADMGSGNPHNPNGVDTEYLWLDVLTKDSILQMIESFIFFEIDKNNPKKKTLIFPRYSHLVLKKRSKHSKIFGTSLNKSVTFFFKIAQACSIGFKSGE